MVIEIEADFDRVNAVLAKALKELHEPKPLMNKLKQYVKMVTMKMFVGRRPDNTTVREVTWPPLAESTLWAKRAARKRPGSVVIESDRPLVRTGKMRDSIRVLAENKTGFLFGSDVRSQKGYPYPGVHNVGGKNGRPPQRKWLFLTRNDFAQMLVMTRDWIKNYVWSEKKGWYLTRKGSKLIKARMNKAEFL